MPSTRPAAARLATPSRAWIAALAALCCCLGAPAPATASGTGFFTLTEEGGVWWFLDPQGEKFLSLGVNHIEPNLLLARQVKEAAIARYGGDLVHPSGRANNRGRAARAFLDEAVERLRDWGFNTLGIHNPVPQSEMPYAVTFRPYPVDGWPTLKREHPDPFDPATEAVLDQRASAWAQTRRDDPMVLGVGFASMPIWTLTDGQLHEWVRAMMELGEGAPGKRAWMEVMRKRYREPQQAARTYGVSAASWEELASIIEWPEPVLAGPARLDQEAFLPRIADNWYRILTAATRRHLPNHLVLGDKIVPHRDLPEWLEPIVARYFDVLFIMWFDHAEAKLDRLRRLHESTGKPILSGDSSFAHPNPRVPNPKGTRVASQQEVGRAYARFLDTLAAEPWFIGWHHCGYMEGSPDLRWIGPLIVRQNGFVRPGGGVYEETVARVREANARAHAIHAAPASTAPAEPVVATATPKAPGPGAEDPPPAARPDPPAEPLRCTTEVKPDLILTRVGRSVYELRVKRAKGKGAVPRKPISWILTSEGVIVIDTSDRASAQVARRVIREQTDLPIRYIIYTHHHGTQLAGAGVLKGPQTRVVAHADLPIQLDVKKSLAAYYDRLNSIQFDLEGGGGRAPEYVYPDLTYDDRHTLRLGDTEVELLHVVGEAQDYTVVSLPREGIVWVADLLAGGMPMVASPMKPVRDVVRWRLALERVRALEPRALLRTAGQPYCQPEPLRQHLDTHIDFLGFLHEAVAEQLNAGRSVQEAVTAIELPPHLAGSPYLRESYGTLEFAVRGVYHRYSGWFDQDGSSLRLIPAERRARSFVADMGGEVAVLERARSLAREGRVLLALEYLDLLIDAGQADRAARLEKAGILEGLSGANDQRVLKSMYRHLATMERERAGQGERSGDGERP